MRNKIILLGPYPPPYGGVAIFQKNLYSLLKQDPDCSVLLLALDSESEIVDNDGNVQVKLAFGNANLIKYFDKNSICLDSSTFALEYPSGRKILKWLILRGLRGFTWLKIVHDGSLPRRYEDFNFLQKTIFRISLFVIDQLIVVGDELRHWFKMMGYLREINVITSLLPQENPQQTLSETISKVRDFVACYDKVICSVGVFIEAYGFHNIISAVHHLRQSENINIGLILVDGCFAVNSAYKNRILNKHSWIMTLEKIAHTELLNVLKYCDAFVRGVKEESYGISRVEAIWCGLPVVATNVGETRGMLLYEFDDVVSLQKQIKRALFDPAVLVSVKVWQNFYNLEAQKNFSQIKALLGIQ